MEKDEQVKLLISWAAPASLILTPIFLGFVIYRILSDKIAGKPVDLLNPDLLFIVFFCVGGFLFALFICKKELGWFNRKK
jgi:hypothetical protein